MDTKEFQAAVTARATGPIREPDLIGIVDELETKIVETTRKAADLGLSGSDIDGVKRRLVAEAEGRWMHTRYASLDMSFTDQLRQILIGRDLANLNRAEIKLHPPRDAKEHQAIVALPVFAVLWNSPEAIEGHFREGERYHAHVTLNVDLGQLPAVRFAGQNYRAMGVRAWTRMPSGITPEMFARIRRCLAFLGLFDLLLLDRGLDAYRDQRDRPEVGVLWAPTDEAWTFTASPLPPAGDPAVLVRRGGIVYVVGFFDTPDEKPIENLVREFSQGPLAKK